MQALCKRCAPVTYGEKRVLTAGWANANKALIKTKVDMSRDSGREWIWLMQIRGPSPQESECSTHNVRRQVVLLGTNRY